uniref:Connexin N-terminal domain-containing protein n=1 Tax=Eptatretus burgeri TaxID=7764 RepID=A0A8C4R6F7_EPTBU
MRKRKQKTRVVWLKVKFHCFSLYLIYCFYIHCRVPAMDGDIFGTIFHSLNKSTSLLGKFWFVLLVARIWVLPESPGVAEGGPSPPKLLCAGLQAGCAAACLSQLEPIPLCRFERLQLVAVALPCGIFVAHLIHRLVQRKNRGASHQNAIALLANNTELRFTAIYGWQLVVRTIIEAVLGGLRYMAYGGPGVPTTSSFLCQSPACGGRTECIITGTASRQYSLWLSHALCSLALTIDVADLTIFSCHFTRRNSAMSTADNGYSSQSHRRQASELCISEVRSNNWASGQGNGCIGSSSWSHDAQRQVTTTGPEVWEQESMKTEKGAPTFSLQGFHRQANCVGDQCEEITMREPPSRLRLSPDSSDICLKSQIDKSQSNDNVTSQKPQTWV